MQHYCFEHGFFPVGQGLFASGTLAEPSAGPNFRWVFDCGTASKSSHLLHAIDRLAPKANGRIVIDLFVISHFDQDHISGFTELIKRSRIRVLLLPYLSLAERLLVAFANGMDSQDAAMGLFLDPVAFLTAIPGSQVEQIVFVLGGRGDRPPPAEDGGEPPPEGEGSWSINIDGRAPPPTDREFEQLKGRLGNVTVMNPGGRVRVANVWEFVPYNDSSLAAQATRKFKGVVERRRDRLLSADDGERKEALSKLRQAYDDRFGRDARNRNLISLFVYGGPVAGWTCTGSVWWPRSLLFGPHDLVFAHDGPGLLYTGDGYLNTPQRLNELIRALGRARIGQLGVLQVMHHGAEGNWHRGVADRLDPTFSVFSSDPRHAKLGHPHAAVLRDFWTRRPVQVDQYREFAVLGEMMR